MVVDKKKEVMTEEPEKTTAQATEGEGQVSQGSSAQGDASQTSDDKKIERFARILTSPTQVSSSDEGEKGKPEEEETTGEGEEGVEAPRQGASEVETARSHSPVAVLKVHGQEIPIYDRDTLIRYAQMGVDYAYKMHQLKQWANEIRFIQSNPQVRELIRKGLEGEDVSKYIKTSSSTEGVEAERGKASAPAGEEDIIKKTVEEIVHQKVSPYLYTLNTTMFIQNLRSSDPRYADTILSIMASWKDNPPPDMPPKLLEAIDTDPNTFLAVYRALRNRFVALEQAAQKVETQKKVSKLKGTNKPPVMEKGSGSVNDIEGKMLEEAESIWNLSDEEFQRLKAKIKQGI